AVDARVERLVRPPRPGQDRRRAVVAYILLTPTYEFSSHFLPADVGSDDDRTNDPQMVIQGREFLVWPEPGVGQPGDAARVVLRDKDPQRVEVRFVEDGVVEIGVRPEFHGAAVRQRLVPQGDQERRVGIAEVAVAHGGHASAAPPEGEGSAGPRSSTD